jgi:hypothetical protein
MSAARRPERRPQPAERVLQALALRRHCISSGKVVVVEGANPSERSRRRCERIDLVASPTQCLLRAMPPPSMA